MSSVELETRVQASYDTDRGDDESVVAAVGVITTAEEIDAIENEITIESASFLSTDAELADARVTQRMRAFYKAGLLCTGAILIVFLVSWITLVHVLGWQSTFGFSGFALVKHMTGDKINVKVGRLESVWHPNEPLDYYRTNPGCKPYEAHSTVETLSQLVKREPFSPSLYTIDVPPPPPDLTGDTGDVHLCDFVFETADDVAAAQHAVRERYRLVWMIDGRYAFSDEDASVRFGIAFGAAAAAGVNKTETVGIYTHMQMIVHAVDATPRNSIHRYNNALWRSPRRDAPSVYEHEDYTSAGSTDARAGAGVYIIGFQVQPSRLRPIALQTIYNSTYAVEWVVHRDIKPEDALPWEKALSLQRPSAIARNSMLSFFVWTAVLFVILLGMILFHYHRIKVELATALNQHPVQYGWYNNVCAALKPPRYGTCKIFIMLLANGLQIATQAVIIATIGLFGLVDAQSNYAWMQSVIISYVGANCVSGLAAGSFFSLFYGPRAQAKNRCRAFWVFLQSAMFLPVVTTAVLFPIDVYLTYIHSSAALSWVGWTWLCVYSAVAFFLNLVFFVVGWVFFMDKYEQPRPTRKSQSKVNARLIAAYWTSRSIGIAIVFGTLSAATICVPLIYISSNYANVSYLGVTLSLLTWAFGNAVYGVIYFYWQLNANVLFWWWEAYIALGAAAFGVQLAVSIGYYLMNTHIHGVLSNFIYFSYLLLFLFYLALATGATAVFAAYVFFSIVARTTVLIKME